LEIDGHGVGETLGDGEAQACSRFVRAIAEPLERHEHALMLFAWHAGAMIGDTEYYDVAHLMRRQAHH
jgi:hypothetical protein